MRTIACRGHCTHPCQQCQKNPSHLGHSHLVLTRPKCESRGNSFTNVDAALYDNNKVVLQWNKSQADAIQTVAPYEETLIIPDGHYTVESLEDHLH